MGSRQYAQETYKNDTDFDDAERTSNVGSYRQERGRARRCNQRLQFVNHEWFLFSTDLFESHDARVSSHAPISPRYITQVQSEHTYVHRNLHQRYVCRHRYVSGYLFREVMRHIVAYSTACIIVDVRKQGKSI